MLFDPPLAFRHRQQLAEEDNESEQSRDADRSAGDEPDQFLGRSLAEQSQEPPAEQPVNDRADQRREDDKFEHSGQWPVGGGRRAVAPSSPPPTAHCPLKFK